MGYNSICLYQLVYKFISIALCRAIPKYVHCCNPEGKVQYFTHTHTQHTHARTHARTHTHTHIYTHFRINYCNSLFHGLPKYSIIRLQKRQNSVARIVTHTFHSSHITPVLKSLHWLPVQ